MRLALIRTQGEGEKSQWLLHRMKEQHAAPAGADHAAPAGADHAAAGSIDLSPMLAVPGTAARARGDDWAVEWKWVQEESQNMGGWFFVEPRLRAMGFPIDYVGRDASASPATGSKHVHDLEQAELLEKAFTAAGAYQVAAGRNGPRGTTGTTTPAKPAAAG